MAKKLLGNWYVRLLWLRRTRSADARLVHVGYNKTALERHQRIIVNYPLQDLYHRITSAISRAEEEQTRMRARREFAYDREIEVQRYEESALRDDAVPHLAVFPRRSNPPR